MKIAYISCHDHEQYSVGYDDEESLLLAFLLKKGLDIERLVWNDAAIHWQQYGLVILKSPWDYHENIEGFSAWLDTLEALNIPLLNPVDIVRWNSDKHYLRDIALAGLDVIPSFFIERGDKPDLLPFFDQLQAEKLIIKPCISAGAKNIIQVTRDNINEQQDTIYQLLAAEGYFVQPFMKEIFGGEWSYIFINGKFSHCVLKMPGGDDFRVQHYHGGSMQAAEPDLTHVKSAAAYVARFGKNTLYARVDGIIRNGQFCLMELEFIEPYLYLDMHPDAYGRYYDALMHFVELRSVVAM